MEKKQNRVVGFDLIRLVACFFVVLVHFNAEVSAYQNGAFLYPNSILPGFLLGNRIYLGDLGVMLFFMLSGAALTMTHRAGESPVKFYSRRALNIFPPFWIAFFIATAVDFFMNHGLPTASPWNLTFSFAGLDGYLSCLNLIPWEYYKVGDWFLGCIVLIYLVFPLVYPLLNKHPGIMSVFTAGLFAAGLLCIQWQIPALNGSISILLCLAEMMLGMLYYRFSLHQRTSVSLLVTASAFLLAIILRNQISTTILTLAAACFLFTLLMAASGFIKSPTVGKMLQSLSVQTYSVFLIHHWLITKLVKGFDLSAMPRMYVITLFIIYLVLTWFAASYLTKAGEALAGKLRQSQFLCKLLLILLAVSIVLSCCGVVKYNIGKLRSDIQEEVLPAELSCQITQGEIKDGSIYVSVTNTGSAQWKCENNIRCGLIIDGIDSGIRSVLEPGQVISQNDTVTFVFSMEEVPDTGVLEAVMLEEYVQYFGNYYTINR